MKKIFNLLLIFLLMTVLGLKANAMTFEEAYSECDKKPMLVIIYAEWADNYKAYLNSFRALQEDFENTFNFAELNIANEDTRFFNSKFHIYPNLPYVLMFRDRGKVSRYIQKDCLINSSCVVPKIKSFIQ